MSDIFINPSGEIQLLRLGKTQRISNAVAPRDMQLLARALIAYCGRHLDYATPAVSAYLDDGTRIHALLTENSAAISIRLRGVHPRLKELVRLGMIDAGHLRALQQAIEARESILFCGPTGSGKTTLMASVIAEIPQGQRIITIEDSAELVGVHSGQIALTTRQASVEGSGEVGLEDLVTEALRMRPDCIALGEVRGKEILPTINALTTGHYGYTTIHTNSLAQLPARISMISGGSDEVWKSLTAAFQLVVVLGKDAGVPKVLQVGRLSGIGYQEVSTTTTLREAS
ncbi:MAG: Flp pilus assembly complex ATPase component TadA [Microbacteriaceae bacterium]|nr:Flp pilus assembly complex ATPase component TadA [Microbacteriaceae bacterium]